MHQLICLVMRGGREGAGSTPEKRLAIIIPTHSINVNVNPPPPLLPRHVFLTLFMEDKNCYSVWSDPLPPIRIPWFACSSTLPSNTILTSPLQYIELRVVVEYKVTPLFVLRRTMVTFSFSFSIL